MSISDSSSSRCPAVTIPTRQPKSKALAGAMSIATPVAECLETCTRFKVQRSIFPSRGHVSSLE